MDNDCNFRSRDALAGPYRFAAHDVRAIVRQVLDDMESSISLKRLAVTCDVAGNDSVAWCDAGRIRQVIQTLLSNAIRFSHPGRQIRIHLVGMKLAPGALVAENRAVPYIEVSVADEGVGIPQELMDSIFVAPSHPRRTKTAFDGNGPGLPACREIIMQHCGQIIAHGRPGGGAVITFILPQRPVAAPDENDPTP